MLDFQSISSQIPSFMVRWNGSTTKFKANRVIKSRLGGNMTKLSKLTTIDYVASYLYLATMTLMGAFIVAIAEQISGLAENVGSQATDLGKIPQFNCYFRKLACVGTVFVAHGIGSVIGSLLGSPVFRKLNADIVIGASLASLGGIAFALPYARTVLLLHVLYFLSGISVGLCDTGANISISKLWGKLVGPWMIALQMGFNLGGFLGIFCAQMFSLDLFTLFCAIGVLLFLSGFIGLALPMTRSFFEGSKMKDDGENNREDQFTSHSNLNELTAYDSIDDKEIELTEQPSKQSKQSPRASRKSLPQQHQNNKNQQSDLEFDSHLSQKRLIGNNSSIVSSDHHQPGRSSMDDDFAEIGPIIPDDSSARDDKDEGSDDIEQPHKKKISPNLAIGPAHYYAEYCLSLAILFNVGSGTAATAFLHPYAEKTGIVSVSTASLQVSMIWLAMTMGLAFSLLLRKYYPKKEDVPYLFTIFSLIAAIGAFLMIIIPEKDNHSSVLWLGLMLFGFCSKPCVGLAFQWLGIVTYATETSFAIAYVGLNLGSGIIPYITTAMWNFVDGPTALFIVLFVSMMLTIPLFLISKHVCCKKVEEDDEDHEELEELTIHHKQDDEDNDDDGDDEEVGQSQEKASSRSNSNQIVRHAQHDRHHNPHQQQEEIIL